MHCFTLAVEAGTVVGTLANSTQGINADESHMNVGKWNIKLSSTVALDSLLSFGGSGLSFCTNKVGRIPVQ